MEGKSISSLSPGSGSGINTIFNDQDTKAPDGNLGFTAAYTASRQAAEVVKILLGRGTICGNKLIEFNLLNGTYNEIPLQQAIEQGGAL